MALRLYNTMTRSIEQFKPIEEGKVRIYICGLTVYDFMHIGHARTYIAFDAIIKYLKYKGFEVSYIQNITDIDDKIIRRAGERGRDPFELSAEFAEKSLEDQSSLGLELADRYPKVSENIKEIIEAVQKLIQSGHAYQVGDNVFFDLSKTTDYGKLSNQDTEQLGKHRIEPVPGKKNPIDFSLWKSSDDGHTFESPWGNGRPGWHIECSVMSSKYLGDQIDIHGGALDLIFPHHENEIAQSEALTGKKPFVKYWMHTGFLNSSGEKMSKSLGNILAVREFLKRFTGDDFRFFVLQSHYRSPIDYSEKNIENAKSALKKLANFLSLLDQAIEKSFDEGSDDAKAATDEMYEKFIQAMDDDFSTPQAIAAIFEATKKVNGAIDSGGQSRKTLEFARGRFTEILGVLGFSISSHELEIVDDVEALIMKRNDLRTRKVWAEADRVRDEITKLGYKLIDEKDGTTRVERI